MLLENLPDCVHHNPQHKNGGKGVAIGAHLPEPRKTEADQKLRQKPEAIFVRTARQLSSEITYASSDEPLMELCAKIGIETSPQTIAALISELIKLLAEEQNAIKAKISANLSRLITPPW
jgi:hypothetical protein